MTVSISYSKRVKVVILVKEAGVQVGMSLGRKERGEAVISKAKSRVVKSIVIRCLRVKVSVPLSNCCFTLENAENLKAIFILKYRTFSG